MVDPLKILWVLTNSTYLVSKFIKSSEGSEDAPYFEHSLYQAEVKESEHINHQLITVSAENHEEEADFRYEISGGNVGDVFSIDPDTGTVRVAGPLDYETKKQYSLELSVTDGESSSYATLVIKVLDVNDNPPVFQTSFYRTTITEEDDRNLPRRILQVNVTDADKDRPEDIMYFLTGPGVDTEEPSSAQFSINSVTGEIYVLKPLDRDLPAGRAQWRFTVFAQDEGGEGLVGYADILVNLKDINDNAPVFLEPLVFANVTENGCAGELVALMLDLDYDDPEKGGYAQLTYILEMNSLNDLTGAAISTLDMIPASCVLCLGEMIALMAALDYDDPEESGHAQLTYIIERNALDELTGASIFTVDKLTGEVRTAVCCLDREKTPDYMLQIVAHDGDGYTGTGTVSVLVTDVNDMPPVFSKDEWVTEVNETEDIVDFAILTVTVIDLDETNDFFYKVVEGSGSGTDKFSMVGNPDGTGSLRVLQPLDFEDINQRNGFRFKIQGPNSSEEVGHVAYSWVIVRLNDINDNAPRLDKPKSEVVVKEDVQVGTVVNILSARDRDQGGQGRVFYSLDRQSDPGRHFRIDQEGRVIVQRELDRETIPLHPLVITVTDQGHPPLTTTATLSVILQDVNDNPPLLLSQYQPVLTENSPPHVLIHLYATDADEHGPPFNFSLDSSQHPELSRLFRVETDPKGDHGKGAGVLSSLKSLDRELQKQYLLPIVILDSGTPRVSGTSTLTVTVGDVNDNPMAAGSTQITAYKLEDNQEPMVIGRVYAADLDDWDLADKNFSWTSTPQVHYFQLGSDTGSLTMSGHTPEGSYSMIVTARDWRRGEFAQCDVRVRVRSLSRLEVQESQLVTFLGVTDVEFMKINAATSSPLKRFRRSLADLLNTSLNDVKVFNVQSSTRAHDQTQVRFFVRDDSEYFKPVRLSGLLTIHREKIENSVGLKILHIGPDTCLTEGDGCKGSCSIQKIFHSPGFTVIANTTGLSGPLVHEERVCVCKARDFRAPETCQNTPCFNRGTCTETRSGLVCSCLEGYEGPRCQGTSREFHGSGYAWYPTLEVCTGSHLSLEFMTEQGDGTLLYNGPLVPPNPNKGIISDFIALELVKGRLELLMDFGSGTTILNLPSEVDDGEWHRVDVLWDDEEVRLVLDLCQSRPVSSDNAGCYTSSPLPLFNTQLNLDTPLQLGGALSEGLNYRQYRWQRSPKLKGFNGCLKHVFINSQLLDLASPALSHDSDPGCPFTDSLCRASCSRHSTCEASISSPVARCKCLPGYSGHSCSVPTTPSTFLTGGFVKYSLAFQPDHFHNSLQFRFRTRELTGELFRQMNQLHTEYLIVEILEGVIRLRMNLNQKDTLPSETVVSLSSYNVADGQWHLVKVSRHGSALILQLDGGEGRRYNESFKFQGHQLLSVDKQEGVFAGGPTDYIGIKNLTAVGSFQNGCLDDLRLDGRPLSLPPGSNGSQWSQVTFSRGLVTDCQSSSGCLEAECPDSFVCQDIWNDFVCMCGPGQETSADGKSCKAISSCVSAPCLHGGLCVDSMLTVGQHYYCVCPESFTGQQCQLSQRQSLKLSLTVFCAVISCLLLVLLLVCLVVIYTRRKGPPLRKTSKKDVKENIIRYHKEGKGEGDMHPVDLLPINEPRTELSSTVPELIEETSKESRMEKPEFWMKFEMENNKIPSDTIINFTFEGSRTSPTGSLSSLEIDERDPGEEIFVVLDPKFRNLVKACTGISGLPPEMSENDEMHF